MSTIKICDAKDYARKWQKENKNHAKAFLIPVEDLIDCLKEMEVLTLQKDGNYSIKSNLKNSGVRAYMGIDRPENTQPSAETEKLLIVGTLLNSEGIHKDLIEDAVCPQTEESKTEVIDGSGVYDFTKPCPNNCDPVSPLYNP